MDYKGKYEFLVSLIWCFAYLDMALRCRKYRKKNEELEKENLSLRSKIEWGIHSIDYEDKF